MWQFLPKIGPLREPVVLRGEKVFLWVEVGVRQVYIESATFAEGQRLGIDRVMEFLWLFEHLG